MNLSDVKQRERERNQETLGKICFDLTNDYRQTKKLPKLIWRKELFEIGLVHSRDMSLGKVPFGHQGFSQRHKKVPFETTSVRDVFF